MRHQEKVILLQNKLLNSSLPSKYCGLKTLLNMTEKTFMHTKSYTMSQQTNTVMYQNTNTYYCSIECQHFET